LDLLSKIATRRAEISVIGLGYVGLPLAVSLAESGFSVTGIDIDEAHVGAVNRGDSYVPGVTSHTPFGFMPFFPGPGLGGHCIPVDPQYLAWKLRTLNYNSRFIQVADEINMGMPVYVLTRIADVLNSVGKPLKDSRVLLLGVSYKADVGDTRESPALDLIELLIQKGASVRYHDPHVQRLDVDHRSLSSVKLDAATLNESDCVVITTAHSAYDWQWVVENSPLIFDTRNATAGVASTVGQVVKL